MEKTYRVVDEAGLHARPASLMVSEATKYADEVNISYQGRKLTLKSIMAVMSLGVPCGADFSIEVNGTNEEVIFNALENILKEHNVI